MHQKQQVIVHIHDKPKKKRKARKPRKARAPRMALAPAIPQVIYNSTSHLNDVNKVKFENMADKIKALQQGQLTPRATVQENLPLPAPSRNMPSPPLRTRVSRPPRRTMPPTLSDSEYQSDDQAPATQIPNAVPVKDRKTRSDKGKKRGPSLHTAERDANKHGASLASMLNPVQSATMEAPLEMSGSRVFVRERA